MMSTPSGRAPKKAAPGPVGSVATALRLLMMFGEQRNVRVAEASRELGVARSTVHRLISMLCYFELVERDPVTRAYHPGPRLAELGLAALQSEETLSTILHPFLRELSASVQETAHLIVLEGVNVRFIDSIESDSHLRTTARKGYIYPAHANSAGKILLAQLDDRELRRLFPDSQLPPMNARTITRRARLFEELAHIRSVGYATNFGESDEGIAAVAVAQRTSSGVVLAAMAVSIPESRLPEERIPELVQVLKSTTDRAAERLP
jgi:IclR family transcriptional regulator, acetate operon repressor